MKAKSVLDQPMAVENNPPQSHAMIRLKATDCVQQIDGSWIIEVPIREMTTIERETIRKLFPHLVDNVYDLLNKEALLAAMT